MIFLMRGATTAARKHTFGT